MDAINGVFVRAEMGGKLQTLVTVVFVLGKFLQSYYLMICYGYSITYHVTMHPCLEFRMLNY